MSTDKMRESFDLWFVSNAPQCAALALSGDNLRIAMRELAWFSWQASRAAIEVELPETYAWDNDGGFEKDYDPDSECSMALIPRIDARIYLESLGLKVNS